jgi:glutathione-independent formaldehyde dehydrogenase
MKAVVYKEPFKVAVEEVPDPRIEHPNDVIVRITSTAICGSDLHMYEGRTAAEAGIVFGHENMGIVQEVGDAVTAIRQSDRVVMPFNVACGFCKNCVAGSTGFCLTVNPGFAGGAYGYVAMGPYMGGQAEYLRSPTPTSTASSCRRAPSTRPTSSCSPTSSRRAITAAR